MSDEPVTVLLRPSTPRVDAPDSTSIITPEQAIRLLEARRAWTYVFGLGGLCLVAAALVVVLGGDPFAQRLHVATLLLMAAVSGVYVLLRRDPTRYRPAEMMIVVCTAMLVNVSGFIYWGVYSAFLAAVSTSGYAFTSSGGRRGVLGFTACVIATHAGLGVAIFAGWIGEHGLFVAAPYASVAARLIGLVLVNLIILTAVLGGLHSHRQMERVLAEHSRALGDVAQRDARLAPARPDEREARAPGEGRHTGDQLGRFTLQQVLGRGAMGEVYAAVDDTGAPVALKVLAAHLVGDAEALKRFHREARAIAGLAAPNIVRMIEVSAPGSALPYLAMERLDGEDLAQLLKQQPVRELGEVVTIVRAVAAGLDAAHEAGVVHRDLKPANVFAAKTSSGVVWKILDFGVSKLFDADATMTQGQLVGTPGYMAPEQARGEPIDRRADVYALGVVIYRLLTGRPAVVPGDVPAMIHEVVFRMPPQPSSIAGVPPTVDTVLAVAFAKSASDRFATAGELAAALAEAASGFTSPVVAERAVAILRRAPWGQWIGRAR